MATSREAGDIVRCPVCLEPYVKPRKLPKCSHTFCETCIISYVSKLEENKELSKNGLSCPFCRTLNPAPKSREVVTEWMNSLERNEDCAVQTDNMDNEQRTKDECDSCHVLGISTRASKMCIDCFQ